MANYLNEKRRTEMSRYRNEAWGISHCGEPNCPQAAWPLRSSYRQPMVGRGRLRKTSAHDDRALVIICIRNYWPDHVFAPTLERCGARLLTSTIRRRLN